MTICAQGLVIKGLDKPYRAGRRGWLKLPEGNSTEAIIGGVTSATPSHLNV